MGAGISINSSFTWLPAGWVGRGVANLLLDELQNDDSDAVGETLKDIFLYPGAIAFFDEATTAEIKILFSAALRAYREAERRGPRRWHDPSGFPGFMHCFGGLLLYLAADERIASLDHRLPRGVLRYQVRELPCAVFPVLPKQSAPTG